MVNILWKCFVWLCICEYRYQFLEGILFFMLEIVFVFFNTYICIHFTDTCYESCPKQTLRVWRFCSCLLLFLYRLNIFLFIQLYKSSLDRFIVLGIQSWKFSEHILKHTFVNDIEQVFFFIHFDNVNVVITFVK